MASRKKPRTVRSKSCGSRPRQGLRSAVSDARLVFSPPEMQSEEEFSPTHDDSLPLTDQNQNKEDESSTLPARPLSNEGALSTGRTSRWERSVSPDKTSSPTEEISSQNVSGSTVLAESKKTVHAVPVIPLHCHDTSTTVSISADRGESSISTIQVQHSLESPNHESVNLSEPISPESMPGNPDDTVSHHESLDAEMSTLSYPSHEDKSTDTPEFSPPLPPGKSWDDFFEELQSIGKRLSSLEKIEKTTDSFSKQLSDVSQRTSEIEEAVRINSSGIADVNEQVFSIKTVVQKHNKDIGKLKSLEETVSEHSSDLKRLNSLEAKLTKATGKVVDEMRDLVVEQRKQMDLFQSNTKQMKANTAQLVEEKAQQVRDECDFKFLKREAFSKRFNIVISGLKEEPQEDTRKIVKDFITKTMNINDITVGSAHRMGSYQEGNTRFRPIVVSFANLHHRNKIWRKRKDFTNDDGADVKVHADLPKKLRYDTQLLYKVMRAASAIPEYRSARIRDFTLELNGQKYAPSNLESLPKPIRPSSIATRESEKTLVFFTSHSFLSNHHPSSFTIQGRKFANVEHYLAFKKAQISTQADVIQRASNATDPLEAKYILHLLKKDHTQEWDENINNIIIEGLRAKFTQNKSLLDKLRATQNKVLGEASTNPKWGIGMTLEDENVLDQDKWDKNGNLLGKALMEIRTELSRKDRSKDKNKLKNNNNK